MGRDEKFTLNEFAMGKNEVKGVPPGALKRFP